MSERKNYPVLASAQQLHSAAPPVAREEVGVDPWELNIWVQGLTGFELDKHRRGNFKKKGASIEITLENANLRLVAAAMIDEHGNKIYRTIEEGVAALGSYPSAGTEILAKVINRLNGQDDDETKEQAGKGSETTTGDSSSSD